jgi:transposase-like protein
MMSKRNDDTESQETVAVSTPARETSQVVRVEPISEAEVVSMLSERTKYMNDPEARAIVAQLLAAGYTVSQVARKMKLRETTVWAWTSHPDVKKAVDDGREYRKRVIGSTLEAAATDAIVTLSDMLLDSSVAPRDRLKAAEMILDRCGLVTISAKQPTDAVAAVKVDIDFDERLARIMAGSVQKT